MPNTISPQQSLPSLGQVNRTASFSYYKRMFGVYLTSLISSKIPEDAIFSFFGAKTGGDNNDVRSQLILSNVLVIRQSLVLGSTLAPCHFVYRSNEPRYEIRELVGESDFSVLVFVGIYPDHDDVFQSEFVSFKKKIPDAYNRFLITNQYDISLYDADDDVLGDYDADVHREFDIPLSLLLIVNNEGKIVWKSLWRDREKSLTFMKNISSPPHPLSFREGE